MRLSRVEVKWAGVIGRAFLPKGVLGGVADVHDAGQDLQSECESSPWYAAFLMRFALWLTWFAPVFVRASLPDNARKTRRRTFGRLGVAEREAILEKLLASHSYVVRSAALFLKVETCFGVLGDEAVLARVGAYEHGRMALVGRERVATGGQNAGLRADLQTAIGAKP